MSLRDGLRDWLVQGRPDLLRILRLVRYELEVARTDLAGRLSPAQRARIRRLRAERELRIHIASGSNRVPGWINVDAAPGVDVQMDLRRALPFSTDSGGLIFSEHFLDHLEYPAVAGRFLSECRRVLEPGGRLRVVLHDTEILARRFVERDAAFFRVAANADMPPGEALNHLFRFNGFHQFLYDFDTLAALLSRCGFSRVIRSSYRGSEIPELNLDLDYPDRPIQSLYVEAVK